MNHLSGNGRSRPAGQEIAPLVADAELVELLQQLDLSGDTRTLSSVPLPLETAWCEQGLGPARSRYGDTRWMVAWRMLLAHALTGWNWAADLRALEQTVTGTAYTSTQLRAVVLLLDSGLLARHYLYLSRASTRPDHRKVGFVYVLLTRQGEQNLDLAQIRVYAEAVVAGVDEMAKDDTLPDDTAISEIIALIWLASGVE